MKKSRLENFNSTQTSSIEQDQIPQKRLRLVTEIHHNEQQQFELSLTSFTDLRLEISSRIHLPSVINEIFELINQFFSNLQQSRSNAPNNEQSLDKFLA